MSLTGKNTKAMDMNNAVKFLKAIVDLNKASSDIEQVLGISEVTTFDNIVGELVAVFLILFGIGEKYHDYDGYYNAFDMICGLTPDEKFGLAYNRLLEIKEQLEIEAEDKE